MAKIYDKDEYINIKYMTTVSGRMKFCNESQLTTVLNTVRKIL